MNVSLEKPVIYRQARRLALAVGLCLLLVAALALAMRRAPARAEAAAGTPQAPTAVSVADENGTPQPALLIVLGNNCTEAQRRPVTSTLMYPVLLNLAAGDCLIALAPQRVVTTTKDGHGWPMFDDFINGDNVAYVIATTNLSVTQQGEVVSDTVQSPGLPLTLTVRHDAPLVLFNLLVSVEWNVDQPAQMATFVRAMTAFSDGLFDASNGQMALGRIALTSFADHWRDADIQIMAANDVWPHADVGGINGTTRRLNNGLVFRPGYMRLGRAWDGSSANQGDWDLPDGYRTILHEFGHYGLALYDEYFGLTADNGDFPSFCTISPGASFYTSTWASLMSYQYKAGELALRRNDDPSQWTLNCRQTLQFQLYNRSDWETLAGLFGDDSSLERWQMQMPYAGPNPGPETVPAGLTDVGVVLGSNAPLARDFTLDPPPTAGTAPLQVYQLANPARSQGPRIVSQGTVTGSGTIRLLGTYPGDSILVIDAEGAVTARTMVPAAAAFTGTLSSPGWAPNVNLTPAGGGMLTLTVSDTGPLNWLLATFVEQGSSDAPTPIALSSSSGVSQGVMALPLPTMTGYLHLRADGGRETILSFSLTDGSPSIHDTAHSPRADAQLERRNSLVGQPVVLWDARGQPQSPAGLRTIGNRIGLQFEPQPGLGERSDPFSTALNLRLRLDRSALPDARANCLVLNRWGGTGNPWQAVGAVNQLADDFVSLPVTRTGTYALLRPEAACLFKRVEAPVPLPGRLVTYTVGLDNAAAPLASNIVMTDRLETVLQPVAATANFGSPVLSGQLVRWQGDLPPDALLLVTMTARLRSATTPNLSVPNQAYATVMGGQLTSPQVNFRTCYQFDLNCDGQVNLTDIALVADAWESTTAAGAAAARFDIDLDGVVSLLDVQNVAAHWGWIWPG